MRILIVNDDGMGAAQLPNLVRWARKLGEVTTFVPKVEQSGKSHSFEIRKQFEVKQVEIAPDVTVWSVDSTPADCVRFAVLGMHLEFDLVISGVNIPPEPKGFRFTRQGGPFYSDDFPHVGGDLYQPKGKPVWVDSQDDTLDTDATLHGYITITPLQLDRTNWTVLNQLRGATV